MEDVQQTIDSTKQFIHDSVSGVVQQVWIWFSSLSQEEWMIVLGAASLVGFLVVRGLGTRHRV